MLFLFSLLIKNKLFIIYLNRTFVEKKLSIKLDLLFLFSLSLSLNKAKELMIFDVYSMHFSPPRELRSHLKFGKLSAGRSTQVEFEIRIASKVKSRQNILYL